MSGLEKPVYDEMIHIPSSEYIYRVQHRIMEGDCQYDHGPRLVRLSSFYIDKYPVTNRRFGQFLEETGYWPEDESNFLRHWSGGVCPDELLNHPVVWVSHRDACTYAVWRGGRLPKDTEWQFAAGGENKYKWPWGDKFDHRLCNSQGDSTVPVDFFLDGASSFGCLDLCGNTWEWVENIIDDGQHIFTFLRGGSYYKAPHFWHAEGGPQPADFHLKFQLLNEGLNRCGTVGFRCVKDGDVYGE